MQEHPIKWQSRNTGDVGLSTVPDRLYSYSHIVSYLGLALFISLFLGFVADLCSYQNVAFAITQEESRTASDNATTIPTVELSATKLKEGKNVIYVHLSDRSEMKFAFLKYVKNHDVVVAPLVRDYGSVYKALIDVQGPLSVLVFDIVDEHGNHIREMKKLPVSEQTFWDSILEWFDNTVSYVKSLFKLDSPN